MCKASLPCLQHELWQTNTTATFSNARQYPQAGLLCCCAVVFTIGPACQDVEDLCKILDAGATCARCDLTVLPLLLLSSLLP